MKLEAKKIYPQPVGKVLDVLNDVVELQNGKLSFSDTPHGKIHFTIRMYGFKWELQFSVAEMSGGNKSRVTLAIGGEKRDQEKMLRREFALIDSLFAVGTEIEVSAHDDT